MTNTLPSAPVRATSVLLVVPGLLATYQSADERFDAWQPNPGDGAWLVTTDHGRDKPVKVADLGAARRRCADIVDSEHRDALIEWTRAAVLSSPAMAAKVIELRRSAAAHGRATGSVGAYYGEVDGERELLVYVDRTEYAGILDGPGEYAAIR
jgi:hypothetical protein